MVDRPLVPPSSVHPAPVARGRALALASVAASLTVLGVVSALTVAPTTPMTEQYSAIGFALVSLVGLVLAIRGRVEAGCWAVVIALLGAAIASTVSRGLSQQGPELLLLGLAPLLAGAMLRRSGLWIATAGSGVALVLGAVVDLGAAEVPIDLPWRVATAVIGLSLIAVVVELVVVRDREALVRATHKNLALERAQDRQVESSIERTNLERAVAQAQRLESLGRLAGSVAHDFNNMLGGIRGNIELAAMLDDRAAAGDHLDTANQLIDRAAVLTRNLLRFAKGYPVGAEIVDINQLLREAEPIYHSLVGPQVELQIQIEATRSVVAFSPAQFEQLLLNLVVNGSDAMPQGGELRIATRDLDDARVELSVSDTGQGMSESIQVMIFQPFFTTKGTGTGIGLSTVQEIVEAAGGEIRVESAVGQGTRFCVLLATHVDAAGDRPAGDSPGPGSPSSNVD